MVKKLHEFGGWLKFFYVINWINLVVVVLSMLASMFSLIKAHSTYSMIEITVITIRSLFVGFFFYQIISEIKNAHVQTPGRICEWIVWYLWISVMFGLVAALVQYFFGSISWIEILMRFFGTLLGVVGWWYIWTSYFKESERVLAYYGQNA